MELHFQGNTLSYQMQGVGVPLVFIHSGGLDQEMWRPQIDYFSPKFQVIAYDLRGQGKSSYTNNQALEIDDLLAILHTEHIQQCVLVGCSLGSIIALDLALAYPEKVAKLVLVSPGLVGFQEHNQEYLDVLATYITQIESKNLIAAKMSLKQLCFYGPHRWQVSNLAKDIYVDQQLQNFIQSGNFSRIPQLKEFNPLNRLSTILCPVLSIYGKLDYEYIHENVDKLEALVTNHTSVSIDHTAHLPGLESPDEFNKALLNFLAQ